MTVVEDHPDEGPAKVDIGDTQRVVVGGPGAIATALTILLLEITDAAAARPRLRGLVGDGEEPRISWYREGRLLTKPAPGEWEGCRLALAFTYAGLGALGRPRRELATFPLDFRQGPVPRAPIVNDVDANAPDHWLDPFGARHDRMHVALFVWEDGFSGRPDKPLATRHADRLIETLSGVGTGLDLVTALRGRRRRSVRPDGTETFIEPFGFADPVKQPVIIGFEDGRVDENRRAHVGEFVLGERTDAGSEVRTHYVPGDQEKIEERVGHHGTFGALRIMAQDVQLADDQADELPHIVGREKFAPLAASLDFRGDYSDDPDGDGCPYTSHVRRANPLAGRVVNRSASRRWLLRRGIPYGVDDRFPPGAEHRRLPLTTETSDTHEEGLIGLFLCASLADQYEGVLGEWLNRGLHDPRLTGTNDELVGLQTDRRQLVTTRGVAYLFFPAERGLVMLTAAADDQGEQP